MKLTLPRPHMILWTDANLMYKGCPPAALWDTLRLPTTSSYNPPPLLPLSSWVGFRSSGWLENSSGFSHTSSYTPRPKYNYTETLKPGLYPHPYEQTDQNYCSTD